MSTELSDGSLAFKYGFVKFVQGGISENVSQGSALKGISLISLR